MNDVIAMWGCLIIAIIYSRPPASSYYVCIWLTLATIALVKYSYFPNGFRF